MYRVDSDACPLSVRQTIAEQERSEYLPTYLPTYLRTLSQVLGLYSIPVFSSQYPKVARYGVLS